MRDFRALTCLILISITACKTIEGDFLRQSSAFTLDEKENIPFTTTKQHLGIMLLEGTLKGDLQPWFVDTKGKYEEAKGTRDSLVQRLTFHYDNDYEESEEDLILLGLDIAEFEMDQWKFSPVEGEPSYKGNFLHLYFPNYLTSDGYRYYLYSIRYEDLIKYLKDRKESPLWYTYMNEEWGLLSQDVYFQDYGNAQNLAVDLVDLILSSDPSASESLKDIREFRSDQLIATANGDQVEIYLVSELGDELVIKVPGGEVEDLIKKNSPRTAEIFTYQQALRNGRFKSYYQKLISENGTWKADDSEDNSVKKLKLKEFELPDTIKKYKSLSFITVENLNWENKSLVEGLFNGVRDGKINAFSDDELSQQMTDSAFFNRWIIPTVFEEDNIELYEIEMVKRFQLVTKTIVDDKLETSNKSIIGIGMFIPAIYTELGLNHPLGYFKVEDILTILPGEGASLKSLSGIPFKKFPLKIESPNE